MAFIPPMPLIRRNHIIKKLKEANATCAERAKSFEEAGILNPHGFKAVTNRMIKSGILRKTADSKYYLP